MGLLNELALEAYKDGRRWFPDLDETLLYDSNAMAGEAGEFCNVVKKIVRDGETYELRNKARKELTDVLVYLLHASVILNMDLERWYEDVREQNEQRFGRNSRPAGTGC